MARIAVIEAPAPIMTPERARAGMPALAGVADATLIALIAAATEELDGPAGWLGRAIGRQTLELRRADFPLGGIRLPLPPIVSVASVICSVDGADIVLPPESYALQGDCVVPVAGWPAGSYVRIRYVAGYDGIPSRISVAVQLRVGELAMQFGRDASLKKEVVEGVGSFEYDVGGGAQRSATSRAVEALLGGLRVLTV